MSDTLRVSNAIIGPIGTNVPVWPLSLSSTNLSCTTGTNVSATAMIAGNFGTSGSASLGFAGGYMEGGTNYYQNTYFALGTISGGNGSIKAERMRMVDTGYIGIGTAAPGEQLSIYLNTNAGAIPLSLTNPNAGSSSQIALKIKSDVAQSAYLFLNSSTNSSDGAASTFTIRNDAGALRLQGSGGYANALGVTIAATTGYVGIGTATPAASLDVPGTVKVGAAGLLVGGDNYKMTLLPDSNGKNPLVVGSYNDAYYCIAFYNIAGAVRGSIVGMNTSSITFNTTSDQRRKDNIQDMPSMIQKIKSLKPRTYTWKESGDKDDGFVAQEVHKIFPQFMTSAPAYCDICHHSYSDLYDGKLCDCCDFENPIGKDGEPHYYGLDYGKFTPYLTKALQETIQMVETQQVTIAALEATLAATTTQLATLEARLSAAGL